MRARDHRMVFIVAGCATDSSNFALDARVRFSSSHAHFSAGMQVSSSKKLARISLEAPSLLSACTGALLQVLRTRKHDKVADDDFARTSEHEEDCLSHILRTESITRRRATLDFARIGNAPEFIQRRTWGHGSDPHNRFQ
jgi:hypothetical protein